MASRKYPDGCPDCDSDKVLVIRKERFTVDSEAKAVEPLGDGVFYKYDILCGNDDPCGFITLE